MTVNGHSAAGQALGYFHQCMWALVELGRRAGPTPLDPWTWTALQHSTSPRDDRQCPPTHLRVHSRVRVHPEMRC